MMERMDEFKKNNRERGGGGRREGNEKYETMTVLLGL